MTLLLSQYFEGVKIAMNEIGRACSAYGGEYWCPKCAVGRTGGKRLLGRTTRKWEDNNRMDYQEFGVSLED
jgi:hypothetical protein